MNVVMQPSIAVTSFHTVLTPLAPTHVPAIRDTQEMDIHAVSYVDC